ncbi:MAG: hypothetical protein Q8Q09_08980 [Deltaproteobacteria bacterium]|nr:hypothetical protein [Deltaproteobacteria bacterium]
MTSLLGSIAFACQALAGVQSEPPVTTTAPAPSATAAKAQPTRGASPDSAPNAPPESPRPPVAPIAQGEGPLCCCRYFEQGWQHGWRRQSVCESAGGSCAAPDHCHP